MSIQLTSLSVRNFLSFGLEQKLDFRDKGLVFVEGENLDEPKAASNGSGKSALVEALVWGLYGKTLRGSVAGDEVINRRTGKDCRVKVVFDRHIATRSVECKIIRARKNKTGKSDLRFWVGVDELTAQGDPRETQRIIDREIGASFDVFTNTSVFGQGTKWRFTELSDADKKAIFDKLLGMEHVSRALDIVKRERDKRDSRLEELDESKTQLEATISATRTAIKQFKATMQSERDERMEWLTRNLRVYQKKIDALKAQNVPDTSVIEAQIKTMRECLPGIEEELQVASEKAAKTSAESSAADKVCSDLSSAIKKLKRLRGGKCNTCGSEITKKNIRKHLKHLKHELRKATRLARDANSQALIANDRLPQVQTKLRDYRQGLIEREQKLTESNVSGQSRDLKQLKRDKQEALDETEKLKAEKPKAPVKLKRELIDSKDKLAKLTEEKSVIEKEKAYYDFWAEGFGNAGIKSYVLDHVVPLLNQRATQYAQTLMGGLSLEFKAQSTLKSGELRDKFAIEVTNQHGGNGYAWNSGGEKRKIDIVVALALQSLESDRAATSCNVAFYDEVFESLDAASCEAVMDLLRMMNKKRETVFVISHQEWLKEHFASVLRVTKHNGFSTLTWE